ncbi:MAG: hypothetical protein MRECE_44c002 [Mycoplasmataceae bacterium CE_OT135]|nr:MAG: hypothetical protein MRECE_44c002 [Mycoplasmataceae bacterium CE_OT135]
MNKPTRHQIYYQSNQEKLKNKRRVRYQIKKKQQAKFIQNQKRKIEKRLNHWRTKLRLRQEAYKNFLWFPWEKVAQIQEKVKALEEKLVELNSKN